MWEYQRSFGKSYMIITREEAVHNFELYMIKNNTIPGFLPLQTVAADGKIQFWYDITGKNSLDMYMKDHKAGQSLLLRLLENLWSACQGMKEYLLYEDAILFEPESIFISNTNETIYFCYQPFEKRSFEQEFCKLIEFFIQKMSHLCQDDVKKCYEVYDVCAMGNFQLTDVISIFYKDGECSESSNIGKNVDKKLEPENPSWRVLQGSGNDNFKAEIKEKEVGTITKKFLAFNKKATLNENQKISCFIKKQFRKKEYQNERLDIRSVLKKRKAIIECEPDLELIGTTATNPTVFLGSEVDEILGQLKYEGDASGTNFTVEKNTFIIGSSQEEADGVIPISTVSRCHARILKKEDGFYIEDMNSTNGTFQNGKILNYRQSMLLNKNDIIHFADIPYRFV